MNKVGQSFEENVTKNTKKKGDKEEQYKAIMDKFEEYKELNGEDLLSNRVKLLIKNMFSNKESGWKMTQKLNQGGPKTKAEVQQEVQDKHDKEQMEKEQARNRNYRDNYGGGGYNDNRRGNPPPRTPKYQKKDTSNYEKKNQQDGQYGKGGRENRGDNYRDKRDHKPREIVEIDDDTMGKRLKKNFEDFVQKKKQEAQAREDRDPNEEQQEEKK